MIAETSSVDPGLMMQNGLSEGSSAYEDQELPEWLDRSLSVVDMFSLPTMFLRSVQAACRFCVEVS